MVIIGFVTVCVVVVMSVVRVFEVSDVDVLSCDVIRSMVAIVLLAVPNGIVIKVNVRVQHHREVVHFVEIEVSVVGV